MQTVGIVSFGDFGAVWNLQFYIGFFPLTSKLIVNITF